MAWLNLTMPNQTVKNGLKAKKIKLPQMNFFLKKLLNFYVPISPFHSAKFLKSFRVMRMCHFWAKNCSMVLNKKFFVQTFIITFIYLLALFIVQNLNNFLAQIDPFPQIRFFSENLLMSLVSFIHAYLHVGY